MAVNKFEKLHEAFYGNCTEGMYEWLGHELGVSVAALRAIQVGWCPVVEFAKRRGYGYFTTPLRDEDGKIVGFSLRDRDGGKCSYPGGHQGCIYVINPSHRKGDKGYSAGSHNWVQIHREKEVCPICGKPDWCLVSSENPSDPKAVICTRTVSDRKLRNGWLHIRKPEGNLSSESILGGTGTVLSVEGMSDVASAYDLGYTAVGRPGNLAGQSCTAEIVRGRVVVVMGENDKKSDGKWPGRDGMVETYTSVRKNTFSTKMLMPPEAVKDLRAWLVNGLTREEFDAYLEKHATEITEDMALPNADPMTVATAFLKDTYFDGKRYLLRRWANSWYRYDRKLGRYEQVRDDEIIMRDVYLWSEGKQYFKETPQGSKVESLAMDTTRWANFQKAGAARAFIPEVKDKLPVWINGKTGPNPHELVFFTNGTLNVPAFLEQEDATLSPPTPDLFNIASLAVPFNPAATCTTWVSFLWSALGDESSKILLLQEWMGYCLTLDTSQQKMMYLVGKTGAGKGTIIRVMQDLAGPDQHSSTSLTQLAESFGLQPLLGKMLCMIPDAREAAGHSALRGFEVLLGITGGDSAQVNRKFKDQLSGEVLTARITLASNSFLNLPDPDGALPRRLNVIKFNRQPKKPDPNLQKKLTAELEGIAIWALAGLKRLREQGEFTVPESSKIAISEWGSTFSPMKAFMEDCAVLKDNAVTNKDALYDCWCGWARDTRRTVGTRSAFLRAFVDYADVQDSGPNYRGLDLNPSAARRYCGRPL